MNPTEAPLRAPADDPPNKEQKAPMRSWRKKYRKLNVRFQKVMEESNQLFRDEHKAKALALRLQEEVDQLLDLLLDLNDDHHLPEHVDLILPNDVSSLQQYKRQATDEFPITKSLEEMLKTIPHTQEPPSDLALLPPDLTGDKPPGFLDSVYEDEYLTNLDSQLVDDATAPSLIDRGIRPSPNRHVPTDKDLQTQNPNSVISWLRRHHPETFIQDKDNNNSERSAAKPRGPGKRMSIVAQLTPQTKADPDAADDDNGFGDDVPRRGGGRRSKDDEPYRPKGGSSKKRKREDGEKNSGRSKKARAVPAVDNN